MFVAIVDSEVIGLQVVPNVTRVVARMRMARDRARKSGKGQMMMAKEKAKWQGGECQARKASEGYCNHFWTLGSHGKGLFRAGKTPGARVARAKKGASSLEEAEASGQEIRFCWLRFGLCSFGNQYDDCEVEQLSQRDIHFGQWCGLRSTGITWTMTDPSEN